MVERRDIEIFLALAEELHFGRTAERLHVSQARVSQVIKRQERRIGAPLFERTSRSVALTPIGRQLRDNLQQAHDLIQESLAQANAAATGIHCHLQLGVMGALGNELRAVIDAFRDRHPDGTVEISEFHFSDPFARLRSQEVDLQLMWLPVHEPDLTVGPVVLTENRVLAVAQGSALAARESVSLNDLAGGTVLDPGPDVPGYWVEAMIPQRTPAGRLIPRGPSARTFHEILALVADEKVICPVNEHVTWYYTHPGIAYVPIHDAPLTQWALVWPTAASSGSHLRAFLDTARDLGTRPITRPAS